jgi:hypothetical protein
VTISISKNSFQATSFLHFPHPCGSNETGIGEVAGCRQSEQERPTDIVLKPAMMIEKIRE